MIARETIERVEDLPLLDVVGRHVKLKKSGASHKGCCPWHDEKTASFHVSPAKNLAKCFGCGEAAVGPVTFIMKTSGCSWVEAIKQLAGDFGVPLQYDDSKEAVVYLKQEEKKDRLRKAAAHALEFYPALTSEDNFNRVPVHWAEAFGLVFSKKGGGSLAAQCRKEKIDTGAYEEIGLLKDGGRRDVFYDRVLFPIYNHRNQLVGFSGRAVGEAGRRPKYLNSKESVLFNKSVELYGIHLAREHMQKMGFAWLVEGQIDVIQMHANKHRNAVAPLGTAFTLEQARVIRRFCERLIIAFDGDASGEAATEKSVKVALEAGLHPEVLRFPDGEDADSYLGKKNSLEDLEVLGGIDWLAGRFFSGATSMLQRGRAEQAIEEALAMVKDDRIRGLYVAAVCRDHKIRKLDFERRLKKRIRQQRNREWDEDSEYQKWGYYEKKNCMFFATASGAEQLSNFSLKSLFLIKGEEPKRIIEITNVHGHREEVDISVGGLVSVNKFKETVEGLGNYMFWGKEAHLNKIKRRQFETERKCTELSQLGYSKEGDLYAFANGIIYNGAFKPVDEYGIVSSEDRRFWFIPYFSNMYEHRASAFEFQRKFLYKENEVGFANWAELVCRVHGNNGAVAILWAISSLFQDIISSRNKWFPHLNLFGAPGAGKNLLAYSLLYLFGDINEPIGLGGKSTAKSIVRQYAQKSNAIVCLDEYKNNIRPEMIETMKNLYDRTGYHRAKMTMDYKTETIPVLSSTIIMGQQRPTRDIALFTRVIYLPFDKIENRKLDMKAYEELMQLQERGVTSVTLEILKHRKHYGKQFQEYFEDYVRQFKEHFKGRVVDRVINNWSVLVATYSVLKDRLKFPFNDKKLMRFCLAGIEHQAEQIESSDDVSIFFDIIQTLFNDHKIRKGDDFVIRKEEIVQAGKVDLIVDSYAGKKVDALYLKFNIVYGLYQREHASIYQEPGMDKGSLLNYMENHKSFIGRKKSFRFDNMITSAVIFEYSQLNISLERVRKDPMEDMFDKTTESLN